MLYYRGKCYMFSYVDHSVKSLDLCGYAGVPVESGK